MKLVFNRSLRSNYSWLPIGKTNPIININAKGRWSIIAAIWSDGEYIIQILNSTITSNQFQEFIWILSFALKQTMQTRIQNVILNMDNASIHTSDKTKKLLALFEYEVKFLPPYTPKLAPVELFFNIIKQKIRSYWWKKIIDFDKNQDMNEFMNQSN